MTAKISGVDRNIHFIKLELVSNIKTIDPTDEDDMYVYDPASTYTIFGREKVAIENLHIDYFATVNIVTPDDDELNGVDVPVVVAIDKLGTCWLPTSTEDILDEAYGDAGRLVMW